jgi:hypothetical protein
MAENKSTVVPARGVKPSAPKPSAPSAPPVAPPVAEPTIAEIVAEAVASALAAERAARPVAPVKEAGYRAYATKEVPRAMVQFTEWINREFADLYPEGVDSRLVTIASKAYKAFQSSDLNRP